MGNWRRLLSTDDDVGVVDERAVRVKDAFTVVFLRGVVVVETGKLRRWDEGRRERGEEREIEIEIVSSWLGKGGTMERTLSTMWTISGIHSSAHSPLACMH